MASFGVDFSSALMDAKRRAKLQGRPVSTAEASGITEGIASTAAQRTKAAEDLALQKEDLTLRKEAAVTQKEQFGQQLAESQRQFEGTLGQRKAEFGGTQGNFAQELAQRKAEFAGSIGMKQTELSQLQRQFDTSTGLEREKLGETIRMKQAELAEGARQFGITTGLSQQQIEQRKAEFGATMQLERQKFEESKLRNLQQLEIAKADLAEKQRQFDSASETQKAQFGDQMRFQISESARKIQEFEQTIREQMRQFDTSQAERSIEFNEQLKFQYESMGNQIDAARSADSGGFCVIVTAATSRNAPEVQITREYRDKFMSPVQLRGYYMIAEAVVPLMEKHITVRKYIKRHLVDSLVEYCSLMIGKSPTLTIKSLIISKLFIHVLCAFIGSTRKRFVRRNGEVF